MTETSRHRRPGVSIPASLRKLLHVLPLGVLASSCVVTSATAQTAGRGLTLSTYVDSSASTAVNSRVGGRENPDFVVELKPGLRLDARAGRVIGSLSYSMGLSHHSRYTESSEVQNQLSASFSAEAIERFMYVDASASISQQAANVYGLQSAPGSTLDNTNRVEVGTVSISPHVRGVIAGDVSYEVRLNGTATNGRRSIASDSTQVGGSVTLSSVARGTALGWAVVGSSQTQDYRAGRESRNDRVILNLSYNLDADLTLALRGGQESNDIANLSRTSYNNWGAGFSWRPSPRTRAQLDVDERYFGRSYRWVLDHRLPSSSISWTSFRDSSTGLDAGNGGRPTTLFEVFDRLFASAQPDPVLREQLVLDFLRSQGQDPNATVAGGFFNAAVTVQDRHDLSAAYNGRRFTLSGQVYATKTRVIDAASAAPPDEDVRQQGALVGASYRLTPETSVSLNGSLLITRSTPTRGGTDLKSLALTYGMQLGRRTTASASARYSVFNSPTEPYREASISASLSHRF
jgi:uncharacterized protein (PEP-CTERM system associated)